MLIGPYIFLPRRGSMRTKDVQEMDGYGLFEEIWMKSSRNRKVSFVLVDLSSSLCSKGGWQHFLFPPIYIQLLYVHEVKSVVLPCLCERRGYPYYNELRPGRPLTNRSILATVTH